jgi:cell pole-organizing protein PopZ
MLELEIKRLSDNIEHLNKLLEAMADTAKTNAQTAQTQPDTTPRPKLAKETKAPEPMESEIVSDSESASTYTADTIKSLALAINKKDRSKRDAIKAKLTEHNAKVATELTGDALVAVGEWLEALKIEVGA